MLMCLRTSYEDTVWGYDLELPFIDTRVLSDDVKETPTPMIAPKAEARQESQIDLTVPEPADSNVPDGFWWTVGSALLLILLL